MSLDIIHFFNIIQFLQSFKIKTFGDGQKKKPKKPHTQKKPLKSN